MRADQARATGNKRAFHFAVEAFVSNACPFLDSALGTSAATTNLCDPNAVTAFALDDLGQEFSCIRREAIARVFAK
jgi:hypothetical protein